MLALDLMATGENLTSTNFTKAHLANIIKNVCTKLKWNEETEDPNDSQNEKMQNYCLI